MRSLRSAFDLFYLLKDKGRQIETSGYDDIQSVDNQRNDNRVHAAENGGQKRRRAAEEHIIGA